MKITICGSITKMDEMIALERELKSFGHEVFMPVKSEGVDYESDDNSTRIQAKQELRLIHKHLGKIENSDAILVANYKKRDIENYIGANTFLEMGFAYYKGKKIFVVNSLPDQSYIRDEIASFGCVILNGDLKKIS